MSVTPEEIRNLIDADEDEAARVVWRERGAIIATLTTRVAELEAVVGRVHTLADAFADDGIARYGGNVAWHIEEAITNDSGDPLDAADQRIASQRERAERAEAALARVEALADEWMTEATSDTAECPDGNCGTCTKGEAATRLNLTLNALAAAGPAVSDGEGATSEAHDCSACTDCIHDGRRCCGCYDGACCQTVPWRTSATSEAHPPWVVHSNDGWLRVVRCACSEAREPVSAQQMRAHIDHPASPVVAPSATDEGGANLASELRKAHTQNAERPESSKRRMPTLSPKKDAR